jgi:hypothetical protein
MLKKIVLKAKLLTIKKIYSKPALLIVIQHYVIKFVRDLQ